MTDRPRFDLVLRGGRVLDPARGVYAVMDVAIADGRVAAVEPSLPAKVARRTLRVRDRLVIPGMIDTHAHVYERIDIGRGGHMSFAAARAVLDAGLRPFTVGGDVHGYTIARLEDGSWDEGYFDERRRDGESRRPIGGARVGSLTQVLDELLALGFPLAEVVAMVTANAAVLLGLEGEIGTLAPGAAGDVTVLAMDHGEWTLSDSLGAELRATVRLRPELTVRGGVVHRADSPLLLDAARRVA